MKILRKTCRDGNLYPVVFNCLKNLPDSVLFHEAHGMRHPFSIYNLSLERVLRAFNSVLEQLELINKVSHSAEDQSILLNILEGEEILKSQKELLESLLSHLDDCLNILKTLHPCKETGKKINDRFVDKWLRNAKHPTAENF